MQEAKKRVQQHQKVSSKGHTTNKMKHAVIAHSTAHETTDQKLDIVPHKLRKQ